MIRVFLATTLLVSCSFGIGVETPDVAQQDDLMRREFDEGHIEKNDLDVAFMQDDAWKSEVEGLIIQYKTLPRADIARMVCQYMYAYYPDITWVVLIYDDITGGDAHWVTYYTSSTHVLWRFHGHNAVVTRYTGDPITTEFNLELNLQASFTPICYRYCHDPACWNTYYHVDCGQTNPATWDKLIQLNTLTMLHMIQGRFSIYNYVGRKYSSTGAIDAGTVEGTCQWDRRVVQKVIGSGCDGQSARIMVLGS